MVALARRVCVRPKLEEECPSWARALLPFSEQEHGLGIPCDRIPQATLEALEYFFPIPVPPKRQRRIGGKQQGTRYARTCGLAVFLACLPFALAKQLDLFADASGVETGEVAVLGFRKLADLARNIGMSYDRVQRWMTILVTLGFIWRFRDGRRTLYVIPLTAYAPRPSADGVRAKLTALLHSQFVEIEQDDGQVVRADRDPEFTNLLIETRARFEVRYQLAPSLDLSLIEDRTWETTISAIQKALPGLSREHLYTIVPMVASHLLQERGTGKRRHFVLKGNGIESPFSIEAPTEHEQNIETLEAQSHRSHARKNGSGGRSRRVIEASSGGQGLHQDAGTSDLPGAISSTHSQDPNADQIDGKSRFNRGDTPAISGLHNAPQAASPLTCAQVADKQNLPLSAGGSSLTLSSSTLQDSVQWEGSADTQGLFEQEQKRTKEHWCQAQGKELAGIFDDQKSLDFYVGVHRVSQDPLLIRAIFIKALYQEQHGGFRDSIGAYFNFMWKKVWGPFRTYDAACAKWQKWGNKRDPKGIPPDIQKLVERHQHDSYTQIAITMGHRWPEAEQTARLDTSSSKEAQQSSMTLQEAEDLIEAIGNSARWYLRDPQIYRADALDVYYGRSATGLDGFVVDAVCADGQVAVFTTFDEWREIHRQMLTLPEEIDAWFEAERVKLFREGAGIDDGMSAQEREDCVRVALAKYGYYGWNVTAFSWEDLLTLGRPLLGIRAEAASGDEVAAEPGNVILKERQLSVRLDDGDLVSCDEYQRAYAEGLEEVWQEEQESTLEGALAVLQAELLLCLHISVLCTCGLSIYRTLVANRQEQAECEAVLRELGTSEEASHAVFEENRAVNAGSGMLFAEAWQYLRRLRRALDSQFYQIRWRPLGSGICSIVVGSQLSGQTYVYDCVARVEEELAALSVQEFEEAEEVVPGAMLGIV